MQPLEFTQGTLFTTRHYVLERDGVSVTQKSLLNSHTFHISFENIPPKAEQITTLPRKWLSAAIVFTVISVICTPILLSGGGRSASDLSGIWFWGLLAVVCWIVFFFKRVSLIIYAQGQNALLLYADRPSAEEVKSFIRKLFVARNKFLRDKYARFAPVEPIVNRLARLDFLRDQEVISEDEYQFMRNQEVGDSTTPRGPAGFAHQ